MQMLLAKLSKQEATAKPFSAIQAPSTLTPAQESAYQAYQWALEQSPSLAQAKDRQVYDFLRNRPDFTGTLPPSFSTFNRYLGAVRLFYDCRKRVLKPRIPARRPTVSSDEKGGNDGSFS